MNQTIALADSTSLCWWSQPSNARRLRYGLWNLGWLFAVMGIFEPYDVAANDQYEQRRLRAGCPDLVSPCASTTYGRCYCGQYIGGGAVSIGRYGSLHGEPRRYNEGTFGMDYSPPWSCVSLMWYHGKKYQGGEGQYQPNRCNNPFPNFFRR